MSPTFNPAKEELRLVLNTFKKETVVHQWFKSAMIERGQKGLEFARK